MKTVEMKEGRALALIELGKLADQIVMELLTDAQLDIVLKGRHDTIRRIAGDLLAKAQVYA